MDFENNGQDVTNFMLKIKKQAKRLFQLSKHHANNLEINNLSKAQEIIAQLNGYPDWHALEKHVSGINNSHKHVIKNNKNQINFENEQNIYFNKEDDCFVSYLRINALPSRIDDINNKLTGFNDLFSFQLNMGIHNVDIIGEQLSKTYEPNKEYLLCQISQGFKLTEEEIKRLFLIDKPSSKQVSENDLTLYLIVRTPIKYKEEHINICLSMLSTMNYGNSIVIESVPYMDKEQWKKFQFKDVISDAKLNNSLLYTNEHSVNYTMLITKWVYLLNFLQSKKIDFAFKVSLLDKKLVYTFNEKDKELIQAVITSILKTTSFIEQDFKYLIKPNFNYIEEKTTNGLYCKSLLHNKLFNYVQDSISRTAHSDFIYGKPGSGKGILNNLITLSSILNKDIDKIPNVCIIDIGTSYQEMLNLMKNVLPAEYQDKIIQVDIDNDDKYSINPFDLPLGKKKYDEVDISRIVKILLPLFGETEHKEVYLSHLIEQLNHMLPKRYDKGINREINKQIDNALDKLGFIIDDRKTWWDVVDFLFLKGEDELAKKAQRFATCILSDLLSVSTEREILYTHFTTNTGETMKAYFSRVIHEVMRKYPCLNQPTQIDISHAKIVCFNLDKVCSFKEKEIQNYWFNLVLDLIKTQLIGFNAYAMDREYPISWKENWKSYLTQDNLENIYAYYNYGKNYKAMNFNKIIIDEYHRFSNQMMNEHIVNLLRESRKNNVGVTITSQSLRGLNYLKDYISGFFISEINEHEEKELMSLGFDKNETALMRKLKFSEWAIKISTNRGNIFDIIKLEIPDELLMALSTTTEDVAIKKELMKTHSYFEAIHKLKNYLKKNNKISYKQISDKKPEEIMEILKELDTMFE